VAKHKALAAPEVAYMMGLTPSSKTPDGQAIKYGRRALVGQYTRPYKRAVETPVVKRISKGARLRAERGNGTTGTLDLSAIINAKR